MCRKQVQHEEQPCTEEHVYVKEKQNLSASELNLIQHSQIQKAHKLQQGYF